MISPSQHPKTKKKTLFASMRVAQTICGGSGSSVPCVATAVLKRVCPTISGLKFWAQARKVECSKARHTKPELPLESCQRVLATTARHGTHDTWELITNHQSGKVGVYLLR
jgi:hypothetical protein